MFGKKHGEPCSSCDRLVGRNDKVCQCGAATPHMDFIERTSYEVDQWRSHRQRLAAVS